MSFATRASLLAGETAIALGWRPDEFWNATPAELAAIVAAVTVERQSADRQTLSQLMTQFPDPAPEVMNG